MPKEHLKEFPVILHTKFQSVFSTESTKKNSEWISKRAHKIGEETKKKSRTIPKDFATGVFKIIIDIFLSMLSRKSLKEFVWKSYAEDITEGIFNEIVHEIPIEISKENLNNCYIPKEIGEETSEGIPK